MRLLIELNGQHRRARGGRISIVRVIMILLALPALVLGCILIFGAVYRSGPASGVSFDDDTIIRQHLHEISPPPPVGARLHNALLALEAKASFSTDPPLVVTGLMIGPGGILLATQSHGVHVYDRQSKTWQSSGDDDTNSDATADTSPGDTNAMPVPAEVSASPIIADLIDWMGERQYSFVTNNAGSDLSIGASFADKDGKSPSYDCIFSANGEHDTLTVTTSSARAIPSGMEGATLAWLTAANMEEHWGFYGVDTDTRKLWFRLSVYRSDGHVNSDELDHVLEEAGTAMHQATSLLAEFPDQNDVHTAYGTEWFWNSGRAPVVRLRPLPTGAARPNVMASGRGSARHAEGNQCLGI
jgi:Putative bacterial sensory transduction regulator